MYLTPKQRRQRYIKIGLMLLLLPFLLLSIYVTVKWFTGAAETPTLSNVVISDITAKSVTVSWVSNIDTPGSVRVNLNGKSVDFPDVRGSKSSKIHLVQLKDLSPDTRYAFEIHMGSTTYTKEVAPFEFQTAPLSQDAPIPDPLFGEAPDKDVVIYISLLSDSTVLSTIPNSSGRWILDASTLRSADLQKLKEIGMNDKMQILVQGATGGSKIVGTRQELFASSGELLSADKLTLQPGLSIINDIPKIFRFNEVRPTASLPIDSDSPEDMGASSDDTGQTNMGNTNQNTDIGTNTNNNGSQSSTNNSGGSSSSQNVQSPDQPTDKQDDTTNSNVVTNIPPRKEFNPATRQFVDGKQDAPVRNLLSQTVQPTTNVETGESTIQVVNQTPSSFTVVWLSADAEPGYIKYGLTKDTVDEEVADVRDVSVGSGSYKSHIVKVTSLDPETKYYFDVFSGSDIFNNRGAHYTAQTTGVADTPPESKQISGVVSGDVNPGDVIVLVKAKSSDSNEESLYIATQPDSSGHWIIDLGNLRDQDGQPFVLNDGDEIEISLLVNGDYEPIETVIDDLSTIESNSYDIEVKSVSVTSGKSQKVALLSDYGLSTTPVTTAGQYITGTSSSGGSQNGSVSYDYAVYKDGRLYYTSDPSAGGSTPNTGISTSLFVGLATGAVLTVMGIMLFIPQLKNKRQVVNNLKSGLAGKI